MSWPTCFSQFLSHGLYSSHNLIMADILCMYDFTHTLRKIFTAWKKVIINNLLHFIFCGCNKIRPYSYTFNGEPNGSFLCKKTYPCILKQYALARCCIFKIVTFLKTKHLNLYDGRNDISYQSLLLMRTKMIISYSALSELLMCG